MGSGIKKSHKEFLKQINEIHGDKIKILSKYTKSSEKVRVLCQICNSSYDSIARNLTNSVRGHGCSTCRQKNVREVSLGRKKKSKEEFNAFFEKHFSTTYKIVKGYENAVTKLVLICLKHGEFEILPNSLKKGCGCNKCGNEIIGNKLVKPFDIFMKEFSYADSYNEYYVVGGYKNSKTKIKVIHKKCRNEWEVRPQNFLRGDRCPHCLISKGEGKVKESLTNRNLSFKEQVKMGNSRKRYDFLLEDIIFIEYDGELHFIPKDHFGGDFNFNKRINNDKIKNQYCMDNKIPLIRIPYWEFNSIEYILENVLIHFNLIENKNDTYDQEIVLKYLVDENWDHDKYIEMSKKRKNIS